MLDDNTKDILDAIDYSQFTLNYQSFDAKRFWDGIYVNRNLNSHVLILGSTGSGKTTLIYDLLSNRPDWIPKIVFFNTMNVVEIQKIADIHLLYPDDDIEKIQEYLHNPKYQLIVYTIPKTENQPVSKTQMEMLWGKMCKICYQCEDLVYEEYMKSKHLIKNVDYRPQCNIVLVNDELMKIMDDNNDFTNDIHRWILTDGQNFKIVHIGATQRHQNISKILTTQSAHKIVFNIDEYDIDSLKGKVEGIEMAKMLKPFHFYYYDRSKRRVRFFKPVGKGW